MRRFALYGDAYIDATEAVFLGGADGTTRYIPNLTTSSVVPGILRGSLGVLFDNVTVGTDCHTNNPSFTSETATPGGYDFLFDADITVKTVRFACNSPTRLQGLRFRFYDKDNDLLYTYDNTSAGDAGMGFMIQFAITAAVPSLPILRSVRKIAVRRFAVFADMYIDATEAWFWGGADGLARLFPNLTTSSVLPGIIRGSLSVLFDDLSANGSADCHTTGNPPYSKFISETATPVGYDFVFDADVDVKTAGFACNSATRLQGLRFRFYNNNNVLLYTYDDRVVRGQQTTRGQHQVGGHHAGDHPVQRVTWALARWLFFWGGELSDGIHRSMCRRLAVLVFAPMLLWRGCHHRHPFVVTFGWDALWLAFAAPQHHQTSAMTGTLSTWRHQYLFWLTIEHEGRRLRHSLVLRRSRWRHWS